MTPLRNIVGLSKAKKLISIPPAIFTNSGNRKEDAIITIIKKNFVFSNPNL